MAKSINFINLVQGEGESKTVIPVRVKTTSERYINKLIRDYRNLGRLDSRKVEVVPVVPLFG